MRAYHDLETHLNLTSDFTYVRQSISSRTSAGNVVPVVGSTGGGGVLCG